MKETMQKRKRKQTVVICCHGWRLTCPVCPVDVLTKQILQKICWNCSLKELSKPLNPIQRHHISKALTQFIYLFLQQ